MPGRFGTIIIVFSLFASLAILPRAQQAVILLKSLGGIIDGRINIYLGREGSIAQGHGAGSGMDSQDCQRQPAEQRKSQVLSR